MPYSIKFNRYFHLATSRPRSTLLSAAWGFYRDFKMPNVQPVPASAVMVSNYICSAESRTSIAADAHPLKSSVSQPEAAPHDSTNIPRST
jgi:hypothetical protein